MTKPKRVSDKERLDWLQKNAFELFSSEEDNTWKIYYKEGIVCQKTIRQAINVAMRQEMSLVRP